MKEVKDFAYHKTAKRFVAEFKNGEWNEGKLTRKSTVNVNESSCVLQYAQTCFEGLKAYRTKDGRIVCFRPDLNEQRLKDSCERMMIPTIPKGMFERAVKNVVKANKKYIPSFESGGSLYLRPFIFGKDAVIGVKPAKEFEFRIFASPVGDYFSKGIKPLKIRISDLDRAAPNGTGHIKAGLNYAMSLYNISDAHEKGYDENLYVDAASRKYIEETGGANVLFVTKDGKLITPKSNSILPSITRRSILYIAENNLGLKVEERKISIEELSDFAECGLCGTAAVISPVGEIDNHGVISKYNMTDFDNTILGKLRKELLAIQHGEIKAPENWIYEVK